MAISVHIISGYLMYLVSVVETFSTISLKEIYRIIALSVNTLWIDSIAERRYVNILRPGNMANSFRSRNGKWVMCTSGNAAYID